MPLPDPGREGSAAARNGSDLRLSPAPGTDHHDGRPAGRETQTLGPHQAPESPEGPVRRLLVVHHVPSRAARELLEVTGAIDELVRAACREPVATVAATMLG
jgi:hypothetical protein